MTVPLSRRREQLRALYGFDFPDDLFRFWEFANRLRPLEPLQALADSLDLTLVGPFDVLAEGMGIVVPPQLYRHIILENTRYWPYLKKTDDPIRVIDEARTALAEGFPGTALKVGKDLWALGGARKTACAYELLDAAYEALG